MADPRTRGSARVEVRVEVWARRVTFTFDLQALWTSPVLLTPRRVPRCADPRVRGSARRHLPIKRAFAGETPRTSQRSDSQITSDDLVS